MKSDSSSSESDEDATMARFRDVALSTELTLTKMSGQGGARREHQRDVVSKKMSIAPNPTVAEALSRVIDGSLTFGVVTTDNTSSQPNSDAAYEPVSIKLFRNGPNLSKKNLVRHEKGRMRPLPRKAVDILPKHRMIANGRELMDTLEKCKRHSKKGQKRAQGIVIQPLKSKSLMRKLKGQL
jgi:hypothetical protein